MKKEYDFSKGVRGKFYRPKTHLNLPIYLDDDVADFVRQFARRRKVDAQTAVNKILRSNKEILRTLE
jgi:HD superfamily phosphodiesterase